MTAGVGATCSVSGVGAAQDEDGVGTTYSVAGAVSSNLTAGIVVMWSITGAGASKTSRLVSSESMSKS